VSDAKTSPSAQTQVEERRTAVVLHAVHWETREPKQESQRGWQSSQRPVAELRNWAVAHAQVPVEVRMAPCLQDVHFAEESQAMTGGRTGDASSSGRLDEAWETGTLASREEGVGLRAGQTVIGSRGRAGLARGVAGLALAG
jgi:hypothetical protein